jgi:hypothetical protein
MMNGLLELRFKIVVSSSYTLVEEKGDTTVKKQKMRDPNGRKKANWVRNRKCSGG